MQADIALRTVDLTRSYRIGRDTVTALCGINLEIPRGEFVAVVGPSGSGKSTLLNLLGGLDSPTRGEIWLGGKNLDRLSEPESAALRRQALGFVFQGYDLLPVLTALENVMYPLLVAGVPLADRTKRATAILGSVGLADKAHHYPDELSGGQQQRVGIARALVSQPLIVLADEPTGSLDSATAKDVLDLLTALVVEKQVTLVLVTHDPDAAARAHRILRLKDGTLL